MDNNEIKGTRVSGGLISIVAAGGGDGVAAGVAAQTLYTLALGKRAVIRKLRWRNRTGAAIQIWIGYGDLTGAGSVFRQVLPSILAVNGIDGELTEDMIPICGNTPEGFAADTTLITGSAGDIIVEASNAGAAPADVQIIAEIEEF